MAVHKAHLIHQIAQAQGLSEKQTRQVVQAFLEAIIKTMAQEGRLELRDFGVFWVTTKPPRIIHHPDTGEPFLIPAVQAVAFRAGRKMKQRVNKG